MEMAEWEKAVAVVNFCVKVAQYQMKHGGYFDFDHPLNATSRTATELAELRSVLGVQCHLAHVRLWIDLGGCHGKRIGPRAHASAH